LSALLSTGLVLLSGIETDEQGAFTRFKKSSITILFFIFSLNLIAYADEVYLENGDKITGEIVEVTEETISIKSEAIGTVSIKKEFIERIEGVVEKESVELADEAEEDVIWNRNVSLGYNKTSGNTDTSRLSLDIAVNRNKKHVNEITLKGSTYYSSSNKNMDAQKWYGSGRYAFSFGGNKRWYNFYKMEADHDRFADVDYRLIPSSGIGYWFYDLPELKAMVEVAIGYERTNYKNTDDSEEAVLIPRAFFEKAIFKNSKFTEDVVFYPAIDDPADYRLRSETVFTSPLSEKLSLNLSLIDEYDAKPVKDTKKNDVRFISSLTYSF